MFKQTFKYSIGAMVLILLLGLAQVSVASLPKGTTTSASNQQPVDLQSRVRHSLLMLPYYSVFDDLNFAVEGDTVTLTGEVRRPLLKSEAERAVRKTLGVANVVNNIEILPLSPMDDSVRLATFYAIYGRQGFEMYGIQAVKPIRIIVKNSHITLVGVVATQLDKVIAEMAAREVPFAFSVTNNLTID